MQILSSHQKETSDYIKKGKQLAAAAAEKKRGPLSLASIHGPILWLQTSKRCLWVHMCGTEQVQHRRDLCLLNKRPPTPTCMDT